MPPPAPRPDAAAQLRAERLLRRVARESNRLFAGSRVRLEVRDIELAERLRFALRLMGARIAERSEGFEHEPDFVLDDSADAAGDGEAGTGDGAAAAADPRAGAKDRIARAAARMPATRALVAELAENGALRDHRVLLSLVLEPKTAALALALKGIGVETAVFAAASESDPAVAAALAADGVTVFAPTSPIVYVAAPEEGLIAIGDGADLDERHAHDALDWAPTLLVDDGSHLIRLAHTGRAEILASEGGSLRGASEETTSGVRPLDEMASRGELRIPVIAANDARTKTGFDNLIGTGQSCVFAIADLIDRPAVASRGVRPGLHGSRWAVVGYGPVGQGVARFASALGAEVVVVERDAVLALAAVHDGHDALPLAEALGRAEVVVSATGVRHTLDTEAIAALAPGAVLAVAGGVDEELALDGLRELGWTRRAVASHVDEWRAPGDEDPGVLVLASGGGVNYTAAEGNPVEVMDLSFATQLAALERLAVGELDAGLHHVPPAEEQRVARHALEARDDGADPRPPQPRAEGRAQPWRVHRYRSSR